MKHFIAALFAGCLMSAQAQTSTDVNEGVRVTADATTGAQVLTWWGRVGRTYFVQQSYDLIHWTYVPTVCSGADAPDGLNFACTDDRQFWRLQYTDASPGGIYGAAGDADGDGVLNDEELALGLNPMSADSDGDGVEDGLEIVFDSDPTDASSYDLSKFEETGWVEFPTTLQGYFKSITNQWFQPPISSWINWLDSAQNSGNESYSGFESSISQKLSDLYFGDGRPPLHNLGWDYAYAHTFQTASSEVGYGSLYHLNTRVTTAVDGQLQPWCVSKNFLSFECSIPNDASSGTYSNVVLHQYVIMPHDQLSDDLPLIPEMGEAETRHSAVVAASVRGYDVTMDLQSTDGGVSEEPAENPDDPPVREAVPGVTDHWVMLPQGSIKTLTFNGTTGSSHRIIYNVSGTGVSVDGPGVSLAGEVRTSDYAFNNVSIIGTEAGEDGAITTGIAYGDTGTANMATNKPLMRIVVYPEVNLKVTVHPITLLSPTGEVRAEPQDIDPEALQEYLDTVFAQANVLTTVRVLPAVGVNWDTGTGVGGSDFGAGNGRMEMLFNRTDLGNITDTEEEMSIRHVSPPDTDAEVNVYFFATPDTSRYNGFTRLDYYPPQSPERPSAKMEEHPIIGQAGKANLANNGVVYVWDYPLRTDDDPPHFYAIAHEIMHYVAKVGHTTDLPAVNHMPNCDNESRLMTGREGPKRGRGPTTLLKVEWDRLNQKYGPNNLN